MSTPFSTAIQEGVAMKTFKYIGRDPLEIPSLEIRLAVKLDDSGNPVGTTFEVPDEYTSTFDAQPDLFVPSRTKSPDVTVAPDVAAALTGPIPVSAETPAPTTTN